MNGQETADCSCRIKNQAGCTGLVEYSCLLGYFTGVCGDCTASSPMALMRSVGKPAVDHGSSLDVRCGAAQLLQLPQQTPSVPCFGLLLASVAGTIVTPAAPGWLVVDRAGFRFLLLRKR